MPRQLLVATELNAEKFVFIAWSKNDSLWSGESFDFLNDVRSPGDVLTDDVDGTPDVGILGGRCAMSVDVR